MEERNKKTGRGREKEAENYEEKKVREENI